MNEIANEKYDDSSIAALLQIFGDAAVQGKENEFFGKVLVALDRNGYDLGKIVAGMGQGIEPKLDGKDSSL